MNLFFFPSSHHKPIRSWLLDMVWPLLSLHITNTFRPPLMCQFYWNERQNLYTLVCNQTQCAQTDYILCCFWRMESLMPLIQLCLVMSQKALNWAIKAADDCSGSHKLQRLLVWRSHMNSQSKAENYWIALSFYTSKHLNMSLYMEMDKHTTNGCDSGWLCGCIPQWETSEIR